MEIVTMGKVVVPARIENLRDLIEVEEKHKTPGQVRRVEVPNALVDTGATMLSLPKKLIEQLGLKRFQTRRAKTSAGIIAFGVYETVQLTVQERQCTITVAEIPDDCPVLIGQVPLELLDFVVDPTKGCLIGNPDHNGEHMMDMF